MPSAIKFYDLTTPELVDLTSEVLEIDLTAESNSVQDLTGESPSPPPRSVKPVIIKPEPTSVKENGGLGKVKSRKISPVKLEIRKFPKKRTVKSSWTPKPRTLTKRKRVEPEHKNFTRGKMLEEEYREELSSSFRRTDKRKELDSEFGTWQNHTTGFGMKILKKYGYTVGTGLGANNSGLLNPVAIRVIPKKAGLDFIGDENKTEQTKKKPKQSIASMLREMRRERKRELDPRYRPFACLNIALRQCEDPVWTRLEREDLFTDNTIKASELSLWSLKKQYSEAQILLKNGLNKKKHKAKIDDLEKKLRKHEEHLRQADKLRRVLKEYDPDSYRF